MLIEVLTLCRRCGQLLDKKMMERRDAQKECPMALCCECAINEVVRKRNDNND